jgi:hypothetical protein
MKKKLILFLTLIIGAGTFNNVMADFDEDNVDVTIPGGQSYFYANMGAKTATGLINGFRLNLYTSTDAERIKKYALASMIANGASLGCAALSQYKVNKLDLSCAGDVAEAFMAFRMYKNAEKIAARNAEMTPEEMRKVRMAIWAAQGCLAVNRVSGITMDHKKARYLKAEYDDRKQVVDDNDAERKEKWGAGARSEEEAEAWSKQLRERMERRFAGRFYSTPDNEDLVDENLKVKRIYSYLLSASPALAELMIFDVFYK